MHYIDSFTEFVDKAYPVYERQKLPKAERTGNELASLLGKQEAAGREIFNTINRNIDTLETLIDKFNKEHNVQLGKNPLEVKIDKTKLELDYLVKLSKLKKTNFTSDIIVSNILNYKILIRPIKNARIIALAYRYYLAIIRHALQNALISIELASDLFFTQISANLSGRRKQMKDIIERITDETENLVLNTFTDKEMLDPKTGKAVSIKNIVGNSKMKEITQLIKTQSSFHRSLNDYDRSIGYNQNVFQDFGRTLESQIKTFQDKEIQALADKFASYANSTTGLTKEHQPEAKEHVANYANSVKQSVEARAMEVVSQICVNMFEIIKMFSLRNIDNYSELIEDASTIEKNDQRWQSVVDNAVKSETEKWQKKIKLLSKNSQDIEITDEDREEMILKWREKGIDTICSRDEFNSIFSGKNDIRQVMKKQGFSDSQISNIIDSDETVFDYGKIYYEDYRDYVSDYGEDSSIIKSLNVKDDESKSNDDVICWMRKNSLNYKKLTERETPSDTEKTKQGTATVGEEK